MSALKRSFKLLEDFKRLRADLQKKRIAQIDSMLRLAEEQRRKALLIDRDFDQLRKQRAYMLIICGRNDEGMAEIEALVADYEQTIERLHEEAAFQLAEAAEASFCNKENALGIALARRALTHTGKAGRLSRTVLRVLELAQKELERIKEK